jgi:hypothetical protein
MMTKAEFNSRFIVVYGPLVSSMRLEVDDRFDGSLVLNRVQDGNACPYGERPYVIYAVP